MPKTNRKPVETSSVSASPEWWIRVRAAAHVADLSTAQLIRRAVDAYLTTMEAP